MSWSPLPRRRVPFIAQMEVTECAPACLAMILAYHRSYVSLAELREACRVSRDGASALDIVTAAERYGFATEALKMELDDLDAVELPAIIHWELNHFVVLERIDAAGAHVVDPAAGARQLTIDELGRGFTGIVIALAPAERFVRRRRAAHARQTYASLLRRSLRPVLVTMASALVLEVFALFFPAASALVVDFVVRPRQAQWIPILGAAFAVAIVLRACITLARERILSGLEARLDVELAASLLQHMLSLPTSFFAQRGAGDLSNRLGALLAARDLFARLLFAGFDLLLVIAYAALMVLYDHRIGAAVVGIHVLSVLVPWLGRSRIQAASTAKVVAAARAQSALVQAFADPETAKAFRSEALLGAQYEAARTEELNANVRAQHALEVPRQLVSVFEAAATAMVLWLGGGAVLDDRMTLGVLTSFLTIQTLLGPPLRRLVMAVGEAAHVRPLLERVEDVFETAPEPTGTWTPPSLAGAITFERVSFRYGKKGPLLLEDVSFQIAAGERVAITGPSGAGKSTIVRLLLGFLQPLSGRILIDGRDLADYDLAALRSRIGTVLADGAFIDEAIADNVTLGAPDATPAQLRSALAAACVDDVVAALPQGALSRLGPSATTLSGGQRQRLLLARALVKAPSLLVLDEASSALDTELELRVQSCLAQLRCTMLVIAHRTSAIAFADRVLSLQGGRVVEVASAGGRLATEVAR